MNVLIYKKTDILFDENQHRPDVCLQFRDVCHIFVLSSCVSL